MKRIAMCSTRFHPDIGGVETVGSILAEGLVDSGYNLTVYTCSKTDTPESTRYNIIRKFNFFSLRKDLKEFDIIILFSVSLKDFWPIFFQNRPVIIVHHTWYASISGRIRLRDKLKKYIARKFVNISVSSAVSRQFAFDSKIVPNPYDELVFSMDKTMVRKEKSFLFVGRLVSDKGAEILLRSFIEINKIYKDSSLTIVGDGPELNKCQEISDRYELNVEFKGNLTGKELSSVYNRHRYLVIPSIWEEPFGVVALEGLACGCKVISFESGGLSEALGGLGILVKQKDEHGLTQAIIKSLEDKEEDVMYTVKLRSHLEKHSKTSVINQYKLIIENTLRG